MSQEGVEVVRTMLSAHDGEDVLPSIKRALKRLGPDLHEQAAIEVLAGDEGWRLCSPEVIWDMSATGLGAVAHGARELCQWWSAWIPAWTRYVYRMDESRDLDEWILTKGKVAATARNGQAVEMPVWQIWKVADGQVRVMRAFLKEADAIAAAGGDGPRSRVTRAET